MDLDLGFNFAAIDTPKQSSAKLDLGFDFTGETTISEDKGQPTKTSQVKTGFTLRIVHLKE